jgi:hypothetical protein
VNHDVPGRDHRGGLRVVCSVHLVVVGDAAHTRLVPDLDPEPVRAAAIHRAVNMRPLSGAERP